MTIAYTIGMKNTTEKTIEIICSACKKHLGYKYSDIDVIPEKRISHSYCEPCAEKILDEI